MTSKTEQATHKKKRDASKRGQVWRSADMVSFSLLAGVSWVLCHAISLAPAMEEMLAQAETGFDGNPSELVSRVAMTGIHTLLIVFGCGILFSAIPSLLMSRFTFGSEVVKFDLAALSPAAGFKRIFNKRNFKDSIKACLYFLLFALGAAAFWHSHRIEIIGLARMSPGPAVLHMMGLLSSLCFMLFAIALLLALGDMLFSYLIYLQELKMTRSEVKREHRELQGSNEIKQERKRISHQLLSSDVQRDIEQSAVVVANPTHIAVGLYMNPNITRLPFISVMETNERARAVIAHARKMNIPVVRNIPLARKLFKHNKRFSFVADDCLEDITEVLQWLSDVEESRADSYESAIADGLPVAGASTATDGAASTDTPRADELGVSRTSDASPPAG
jgi:flagellar biosynthesis protein FlhB